MVKRELREVLGEGGTQWVTRESADLPHPVPTTATGNELQRGIRTGNFVARKARSGLTIPVHLVVESRNQGSTVFDRIVETSSIDAGTSDGLVRNIAAVILPPGEYWITASTTQSTPLPAGGANGIARDLPK